MMYLYKNFTIVLVLSIFLISFLSCETNSVDNQTTQTVTTNTETEAHSEDEHANEIVLSPDVLKEVEIEIMPVSKREFTQFKTFPGTVMPRPDGDAHIGSLVSGRVVEIPVGIGQKVTKGTPLCRIESPEVGVAQAAYIRAAAQNVLAQQDFVRHQKLIAESIGSEKSLIEKEAAAHSAKAELDATLRTLISIGLSQSEVDELSRNHATSGILTLKSPINGTVTERFIHLGERVEPDRDLFHIVDLSRLWVKMAIYERDLIDIRNQQPVEIIPQARPDEIFKGKIVQMGMEVDQNSRTINCYVEIQNRSDILIPFLFVNCQVEIGNGPEKVLAIPNEAIIIDEHGDQTVFIEREPGHYSLQEIEIGRSTNGWTEIVNGLEQGDGIVSKGAFFIKSEMAKGSFGHGHAH
ncbi:efflux RND transporter periplasmic adaptor subunit [candidate division KSB1 bacterium]|nr:efflux RND transporter periplasmic adaptor subunit [candidate division KSB1 bacterium]